MDDDLFAQVSGKWVSTNSVGELSAMLYTFAKESAALVFFWSKLLVNSLACQLGVAH